MKKYVVFLLAMVFLSCSVVAGDLAVLILFDTSRSIDSNSFMEGKSIAEAIINNLEASDDVALISFDDKPSLVVPLGSGRAAVLEGLNSLALKGDYTAFYDAIYDASEKLSKSKNSERVIFTITDGKDENSALLFEDAASKVKEDGVVVVSMSIGRLQASQPLRRLSKLTDGIYIGTPEPSSISEILPKVRTLTAAKAEAIEASKEKEKPEVVAPEPVVPVVVPQAEKKSPNLFTYVIIGLLVLALFLLIVILRKKPAVVETVRDFDEPSPSSDSESFEDKLEKTFVERRPSDDDQLEKTFVLAEKAYLEVEEESGRKTEYPLQILGSTYIGRSSVNEVKLDDESISSQHCRIDHRDDRFRLYDLGSTNGTILNGVKIERSDLKDGDTVQLGKIKFKFKVERSV